MRSKSVLLVPAMALSLTSVAAGPAAPNVPAGAPAMKPVDSATFDPSVKPCEDFYQYAVGGWLKANPIPADKSRWGSFEELADGNRAILRSILEETSAKSDWPKGSAKQKVGDFFASGMDETAIERAGTKPLEPWLAKIDGVKSNAGLPKLVAELHGRRLMAGYGFYVSQDQKESTRYIAALGQGGLGLPDRDYYLKDDAKSKEVREVPRPRGEDARAPGGFA